MPCALGAGKCGERKLKCTRAKHTSGAHAHQARWSYLEKVQGSQPSAAVQAKMIPCSADESDN